MPVDLAGLAVSFAILALAGDQLVVGIARLAGALRLRPTVVGALVGGLGTSLVELAVAALAAERGSSQLALGSLAGSVNANVCLALAPAALIKPLLVESRTVRREAPLSVAAVLLFAALSSGVLAAWKGAVLALALIPAVVMLVLAATTGRDAGLEKEVADLIDTPRRRPLPEVLRTIVSTAVMIAGAELMVTASVALSKRIGLAQGVAGLTIVGIGTSAPLIASTVQGTRRGEHDLVAGNVLGGNLFIALGGGAIVGLVSGHPVRGLGTVPLVVMCCVVVGAWLAMGRGGALTRAEAALLLAVYLVSLPFASR